MIAEHWNPRHDGILLNQWCETAQLAPKLPAGEQVRAARVFHFKGHSIAPRIINHQ
jgi:hypothetical protein